MEIYAYILNDDNNTIAATISTEFVPEGVEHQVLTVPFYPIDLKIDNNGNIVPDFDKTLSFVRKKHISIISNSCQAAILSGFKSNALGSTYSYPSNVTDQININNAVVSGGSLWCMNDQSEWSFMQHSPEQASVVQKNMITHIQSKQNRYNDLVNTINTLTSKEDIQKVEW